MGDSLICLQTPFPHLQMEGYYLTFHFIWSNDTYVELVLIKLWCSNSVFGTAWNQIKTIQFLILKLHTFYLFQHHHPTFFLRNDIIISLTRKIGSATCAVENHFIAIAIVSLNELVSLLTNGPNCIPVRPSSSFSAGRNKTTKPLLLDRMQTNSPGTCCLCLCVLLISR